MDQIGKLLIAVGVLIVVVGFLLTFGSRLPLKLGRLPLDFQFQRDNVRFYFPLGTSILISIVLSVVVALFSRGR